MTVEEFNQLLESKTNHLAAKVVVPAVQELVSLIKNRVVESGLSENRNLFSAYSAAYLKKKKKRVPDASFKNFSYTGEMWKSFEIQDIKETKESIVVEAYMSEGGRDGVSSQDLVEIHSYNERKEIIAPTKQEEKMTQEEMDRLLQKLYNE